MKNQLDLIVSIVAVVLAIGLSLTFYFTKRQPLTVTDPSPIVTANVTPPAGSVVTANALAGGGSGGGGAAAGGGPPAAASNFRGGLGGFSGASGRGGQ